MALVDGAKGFGPFPLNRTGERGVSACCKGMSLRHWLMSSNLCTPGLKTSNEWHF